MKRRWLLAVLGGLLVLLLGGLLTVVGELPAGGAAEAADLARELKGLRPRIVFETFRDGNWELYAVDADGSNPVNLTRTPRVHELYPHVSPDGTRICFVADEGVGDAKIRNVYCMEYDGSQRTLVAKNAREPCWSGDGKGVVYLKSEYEQYTPIDYATKGIYVYDLASKRHWKHPNTDLYHLYNICCTPDGKWFIATVHGGMGYKHAILAIDGNGPGVYDLKLPGCRPDVSADGKKIAWGCSDWTLRMGELDFSGPEPKVINQRNVIESRKPMEAYHVDWSPDGRYVAFSRGPVGKRLGPAPEMVGIQAPGWDICVADAAAVNRYIVLTHDGQSNKEPDWAPIAKD